MGVAQKKVEQLVASNARRSRKSLIAGFRLHRVGVEIDSNVDQRTWYDFGKLLQQIDYAREWVIADWLAFGEHKYGDKIYESAARLLGKSPRTWEDYAYIARNVRTSERSEILSPLVHRPVARFGDNPALQRQLIAVAEEHALSKATFEAVIKLFLDKKPYDHLLASDVQPVERARLRAEQERARVLKRARKAAGESWIEFAREQAAKWRQLVELLEGSVESGAHEVEKQASVRRVPRRAGRVDRSRSVGAGNARAGTGVGDAP